MDKNTKTFYGAPLYKSLIQDQSDDVGPINARRARYNESQTVRDERGRQRFHGAFTGGFSAGHFNSVGTVEGFRPKQFVSHRKSDQTNSSNFSHKPEDYMDEEDFGEFGIAPKKIRLSRVFDVGTNSREYRACNRSKDLQPSRTSIGERILRKLNAEMTKSSIRLCSKPRRYLPKNDFHGLGYEPLRQEACSRAKADNADNPLSATFKGGQRLRISGEAFGTGVLNDYQDNLEPDSIYGYDTLDNYVFDRVNSKKENSRSKPVCSYADLNDPNSLNGFVLFRASATSTDNDNLIRNFPPPVITDNWKMPTCELPKVQKFLAPRSVMPQTDPEGLRSLLGKKFFNSSQVLRSDDIETRSGLLHYSELRPASDKIKEADSCTSDLQPVAISRKKVEWRPCGLLCKRFNVPNPFPDNLFTGVKPEESAESTGQRLDSTLPTPLNVHEDELVSPLELRRSIFNVALKVFEGALENSGDESPIGEDEPQIVEIRKDFEVSSWPMKGNVDVEPGERIDIRSAEATEQREMGMFPNRRYDDDDQSVIIVPTERREPEIILLDSSTSSSPSDGSPKGTRANSQGRTHLHDLSDIGESDDSYGPPLPPSRGLDDGNSNKDPRASRSASHSRDRTRSRSKVRSTSDDSVKCRRRRAKEKQRSKVT